MFALIGIKQELEDGAIVRWTWSAIAESMNAFLKQRIQQEAIYV